MPFWITIAACAAIYAMMACLPPVLLPEQRSMFDVVTVVMILLLPYVAQMIDGLRTLAPTGRNRIGVPENIFSFVLRNAGLGCAVFIALFAVLLAFGVASQGLGLLLAYLVAPPFISLFLLALAWGADKFGIEARYFKDWYMAVWVLLAPLLPLSFVVFKPLIRLVLYIVVPPLGLFMLWKLLRRKKP